MGSGTKLSRLHHNGGARKEKIETERSGTNEREQEGRNVVAYTWLSMCIYICMRKENLLSLSFSLSYRHQRNLLDRAEG